MKDFAKKDLGFALSDRNFSSVDQARHVFLSRFESLFGFRPYLHSDSIRHGDLDYVLSLSLTFYVSRVPHVLFIYESGSHFFYYRIF